MLLHRYKLVTIRRRVKNESQHLCRDQGVQRKHKLWSKAGRQELCELPCSRGRRAGARICWRCWISRSLPWIGR